MARRLLVTLLTDFGTADPYVAAMKGVMHLVSDAEMQVLSDWLAGLDPSK